MRSDADKRFLALRNSGYKGPIDQDGYKTTDKDVRDRLWLKRQASWDALLSKHGAK